jgi:L-lactate utilization protein LutB
MILEDIYMDYTTLIETDNVEETMDAVEARGISVEFVENRNEALVRILAMIPDVATLATASSVTLSEIGLKAELESGKHSWRNLSAEMRAESDPIKRALLRRESATADYAIGSVAAIAQTGEIVVASGSGSQLSPYLSSKNVIWVAGVQKIVPTLEDAVRRVREYCAPKVEELGKKTLGRDGAGTIGKLLIFENEAAYLLRNVHLILVNESLGF